MLFLCYDRNTFYNVYSMYSIKSSCFVIIIIIIALFDLSMFVGGFYIMNIANWDLYIPQQEKLLICCIRGSMVMLIIIFYLNSIVSLYVPT